MAYAGALLDRSGLTLLTCPAAPRPALHRQHAAAALYCPLLLLLLLTADHRPPLLPSAHCCPHTHLPLPQNAASKGALLPLSRSLASAWGKDNIQVCRGSLQPLWKSCARWIILLPTTHVRVHPSHPAPLPGQHAVAGRHQHSILEHYAGQSTQARVHLGAHPAGCAALKGERCRSGSGEVVRPAGPVGVAPLAAEAGKASGVVGRCWQAALLHLGRRCTRLDHLPCVHAHAGRIGVAQDMVGPALFLAYHASDNVTGAELLVDGGGAALPMLAAQDPDAYKA